MATSSVAKSSHNKMVAPLVSGRQSANCGQEDCDPGEETQPCRTGDVIHSFLFGRIQLKRLRYPKAVLDMLGPEALHAQRTASKFLQQGAQDNYIPDESEDVEMQDAPKDEMADGGNDIPASDSARLVIDFSAMD